MAFWSGFEKIVRQAEPLAMHTWFQLGGPAEFFAEPDKPDQLIALVERSQQEGIDVRLLGQGSNVLVRDEGIPGLVVKLSAAEFGKIEVAGAADRRRRRRHAGPGGHHRRPSRPGRTGNAHRHSRHPRRRPARQRRQPRRRRRAMGQPAPRSSPPPARSSTAAATTSSSATGKAASTSW